MKHERRDLLSWLVAFFVPLNIYVIFYYAPVEKTMGMIQKVFYFHVASAWVGLLAFCVVFGCSILYLHSRRDALNHLAMASAEIGTIFISGTLLTGPLWAYPIWNTWWTWDPRLTTTLVLWFMYIAYIALQTGERTATRRRLAAVYGIVAFINVPLVFFSARWWRSIHPIVVSSEGMGLEPKMLVALVMSVAVFSLLYIHLVRVRVKSIVLREQIKDLKAELFR